jgi:hypothetical protein
MILIYLSQEFSSSVGCTGGLGCAGFWPIYMAIVSAYGFILAIFTAPLFLKHGRGFLFAIFLILPFALVFLLPTITYIHLKSLAPGSLEFIALSPYFVGYLLGSALCSFLAKRYTFTFYSVTRKVVGMLCPFSLLILGCFVIYVIGSSTYTFLSKPYALERCNRTTERYDCFLSVIDYHPNISIEDCRRYAPEKRRPYEASFACEYAAVVNPKTITQCFSYFWYAHFRSNDISILSPYQQEQAKKLALSRAEACAREVVRQEEDPVALCAKLSGNEKAHCDKAMKDLDRGW